MANCYRILIMLEHNSVLNHFHQGTRFMQSILINMALKLTSWLPLPLLHAIGNLLGRLFYWLPNDLRRVTRINTALCLPELTAAERKKLEKASLIEMAKTGLELGPMWLWSKQRSLSLIRNIHGQDQLDIALKRKQGVILALPHIGMWEILGVYGSINYPMTSLYRPPRLAPLEKIMRNGRERFGATLVATDVQGIRQLYKALSRGELVAILPDQEPRWGNGVFAPFFGVSAYTATLLTRIAHRSQATVLLAWAERLPYGQGFDLHFEDVDAFCYDQDPLQSTTALNAEVERCVQTLPTQYQWHYRRFRTRPKGQEQVRLYRRK